MAAASSAIDGKIAPGKAPNAAANGASFSKEEELTAYRNMLLIRRFEEKPVRCMAWVSSAAFAISISVKRRS
jgi:TPP-dependent pyruvate/acetoin dehydrogenase alpha subunit